MKTFSPHKFLCAMLLASSLPACGGAVGEALRPNDHTAAGALTAGGAAATCAGSAKYAKPLIVDLDPDTRVDLEAAMKKGLVIVGYDCANLRVLSSCKLPETGYEYAGVSRKEQVVQIKNADDLSVNLPLSSAKLSAELTSGRTIDLALVLVGRRSTTVAKVDRADLVGGCEGATHYLTNATLGAFSMQTGSVGKAAAVAEMFGRGGSASSNAERKAMNSDGSLDDCRTSNPDAEAPPTECRAPIRVELLPIGGEEPAAIADGKEGKGDKKDKKDKTKESVAAEVNPCPAGYSFVDGLCTKAAEKGHLCVATDEAECKEQCEKGSPDSCYNYGLLLTKKSPREASIPFFKKACDAEIADGCTAYGKEILPGDMDEPGAAAKAKESVKVLQKACAMGSAKGCDWAGFALTDPDFKVLDKAAGVRAYDRGCSLGNGESCSSLSEMYFEGNGVGKDPVMGVSLLIKSCQGGSGDECAELGEVFTKGLHAVAPDKSSAIRAWDRACDLDKDYCGQAGEAAAHFDDFAQAFNFATRACAAKDEDGCAMLGDLYNDGKGTAKDPAKARESWTTACEGGEGNEKACKRVGIKIKN